MIIGSWVFSVTPDQNFDYHQGVLEDRSVFWGEEIFTFNVDQTFALNGELNGTWSYSNDEILIDLDKSYACGDFPHGGLEFDVLELSPTDMHVKHNYHTYSDNKYQLSKQ